jgi:hypothetical protein
MPAIACLGKQIAILPTSIFTKSLFARLAKLDGGSWRIIYCAIIDGYRRRVLS